MSGTGGRFGNYTVIFRGGDVVASGQSVGSLAVLDGPVTVSGTVTGRLLSVNGAVHVTSSGKVSGDIASLKGHVTIDSGATVGGSITSFSGATVQPGAHVSGSVRRYGSNLAGLAIGGAYASKLAAWLLVTLSLLLLGIVVVGIAGRRSQEVLKSASSHVGADIGIGVLLLVGLPLLGLVTLFSVVLLPFGFGLLLALSAIYSIGYTVTAWTLGRAILRPGKIWASFFLGWGILRVLALIPVVGALAWFVATLYGLGTIAAGLRLARRGLPELGTADGGYWATQPSAPTYPGPVPAEPVVASPPAFVAEEPPPAVPAPAPVAPQRTSAGPNLGNPLARRGPRQG